jgi:hypothetical protein
MWHLPLRPVFCRPVGVVLLGMLATGSALAAEPAPTAPAATVEIGVRSTVDPRWEGVHRRGPIEHGKVYLIASLQQSPVGPKLVQPVDEAGLLQQFRQVLNAQGFRECGTNETPDVVLTLLYGRGHLRNPYLANIVGDIGAESIVPTQMESSLAATVDPRLYEKRMRANYEHKVVAAQKEKLFIRVAAWQYPGERKAEPVQLWKTTMVVDDPATNDLNALYPQMLAAGVRFFDRTSPEEEVRIAAPLNGTVKMAPLEILDSDAPVAPSGNKTPQADAN